MEGLRLLRDARTVTALRRRVAARKCAEDNQNKERLLGSHRPTSVELAKWLCIDFGTSVNGRKARYSGQPANP